MQTFYKEEVIPKIKEEKKLQKQINNMRNSKATTQQGFYPEPAVKRTFNIPRLSALAQEYSTPTTERVTGVKQSEVPSAVRA